MSAKKILFWLHCHKEHIRCFLVDKAAMLYQYLTNSTWDVWVGQQFFPFLNFFFNCSLFSRLTFSRDLVSPSFTGSSLCQVSCCTLLCRQIFSIFFYTWFPQQWWVRWSFFTPESNEGWRLQVTDPHLLSKEITLACSLNSTESLNQTSLVQGTCGVSHLCLVWYACLCMTFMYCYQSLSNPIVLWVA